MGREENRALGGRNRLPRRVDAGAGPDHGGGDRGTGDRREGGPDPGSHGDGDGSLPSGAPLRRDGLQRPLRPRATPALRGRRPDGLRAGRRGGGAPRPRGEVQHRDHPLGGGRGGRRTDREALRTHGLHAPGGDPPGPSLEGGAVPPRARGVPGPVLPVAPVPHAHLQPFPARGESRHGGRHGRGERVPHRRRHDQRPGEQRVGHEPERRLLPEHRLHGLRRGSPGREQPGRLLQHGHPVGEQRVARQRLRLVHHERHDGARQLQRLRGDPGPGLAGTGLRLHAVGPHRQGPPLVLRGRQPLPPLR